MLNQMTINNINLTPVFKKSTPVNLEVLTPLYSSESEKVQTLKYTQTK